MKGNSVSNMGGCWWSPGSSSQHVIWPNRNASEGQSQVLVALEQTTLLDKSKQFNPCSLNDLTFSAIGKGKNQVCIRNYMK